MSQIEKVKFLDKLRHLFETSDLDSNDVCIVGSSSLAALGLRQNKDIDLICTPEIKQCLIKQLKENEIYGKIEIVNDNWSYFDESIDDSQIIEHQENHFLFCGIKFVSIKLLQDRKKSQGRPKDAVDLQLIEEYFDSKRNS